MAFIPRKTYAIMINDDEGKKIINKIKALGNTEEDQNKANKMMDEFFAKRGNSEERNTTNGDKIRGNTNKEKDTFNTDGEERPLNDNGEVVDEVADNKDDDFDLDEEFEKEYIDNLNKEIDEGEVSELFDRVEEADEYSDKEKSDLEFKINAAKNAGLINEKQHRDLMDKLYGFDENEDSDFELNKENSGGAGSSFARLEEMDRREKESYADLRADMDRNAEEMNNKLGSKKPKFDINEANRRALRSAAIGQAVQKARENGQSPQQIMDTVSYDMDIEPGSEEFNTLKSYVMYDTRMNKETGEYEYNKYTIGSDKLLEKPEDREKMANLAAEFKKAGLDVKVEDGWEDYGAKMQWTNLTSGDTWVLNPRDWLDYMNGNATAEEIVDRVKKGNKGAFKFKEAETEDNKEWRLKPENLAIVQELRDLGLDTGSMSEEDFDIAREFLKRFGKK